MGVRFDEPVGRGGGTVRGKRVFDCGKEFGGFVRGKNVAVGDYPERPFVRATAPVSVDSPTGCRMASSTVRVLSVATPAKA